MDALQIYVAPESLEETKIVLESILDVLTTANALYYEKYPLGPCCPKCAGIKYKEPVEGHMVNFSTIEPMYVRGWGACGEIAAMVAGKRRHDGDPGARVILEATRPASRTFHALVALGDGTILDPTADLARVEEGCLCPPGSPSGCIDAPEAA